jgi:arsenic resistance protein ArsH
MTIPDLPNIKPELLDIPNMEKLAPQGDMSHPPRSLMLYGSLRERSFSRFLTYEAARILEHFGAEVRIFDPMELPMVGSVPESHPKVVELRELCLWSEGRAPPEPGPHAGCDAGLRRLTVVQRGQHAAPAGALDAHVHDPEPVLGADGLQRVR